MRPPLRHRRARCRPSRGVALGCLLLLAGGAGDGALWAEERSAATMEAGGMFIPDTDPRELWRETRASVAAEWPLARVVEPDFADRSSGQGVIESAWVEPPAEPPVPGVIPTSPGLSPPRRQRLIVRFSPGATGAWIEAMLQTQSIAEAHAPAGPGRVELIGGWRTEQPLSGSRDVTTMLVARLAPAAEPIYPLPRLSSDGIDGGADREPPWAHSGYPRLARSGYKVVEDYRNFYSCDSLVCLTAAFGAGALMANTGFDTTMQTAWQQSVTPTDLGTFFSDCKPLGEGRYALPVFGVAAITGIILEGNPTGDIIGEWGSRSLRMFVVGAPPLYVLQLATGASRPVDGYGSQWHMFNDNNGVSGHAFIGAIPFLAAAEMVENPWAKGGLYVCSTFTGLSRINDNAHYPSQVFLGWYLAFASSVAVSRTEMHFDSMVVRVVPLPIADLGGLAVEGRW
ncbi:MAG: phosphatase PAP2 family protein [Planctomycetia bacterium]